MSLECDFVWGEGGRGGDNPIRVEESLGLGSLVATRLRVRLFDYTCIVRP